MNCYKNVRESLEALNELNNSKTEFGMVKETDKDGETTRPATIKDLNSEIIANICDLLGMSDIYLEGMD